MLITTDDVYAPLVDATVPWDAELLVYQLLGRKHIPVTRLNSQTVLRLEPDADLEAVLRHIPHDGRFKVVARASGRIAAQAVHRFEVGPPPPPVRAPQADSLDIDAVRQEQLAALKDRASALEAQVRRADGDREEARQRAAELAVQVARFQTESHHLTQRLAEARAELAALRRNVPRSDDDDVSVLGMLGTIDGGFDVVSRLSDPFGNLGKKKRRETQ